VNFCRLPKDGLLGSGRRGLGSEFALVVTLEQVEGTAAVADVVGLLGSVTRVVVCRGILMIPFPEAEEPEAWGS
jgi:hypothetical protein